MSASLVAAVVDTNVLLSSLLGRFGASAEVVSAFRACRFSLVTSRSLLEEFRTVTLRPELTARFNTRDLIELWALLREGARIVTPAEDISVVDDPVDNILFTTALAGGAQAVVTGDKELLALEAVRDIPVLTPRQFLVWLTAR